jgi:hypothetical protein
MGTFTTVFDAISTELTQDDYTAVRSTFNTHGTETVTLLIDYTNGAETSAEIQVELWDASEGWFIVPYTFSTMAVEWTSSVDAAVRWNIRRIGRFETQMRISAKGTGADGDATTSLTVRVQLGGSRYPIAGNYE